MHWVDHMYLPEVAAVVERMLVNSRGQVDGLILASGLEVHVPPHLHDEVRSHVRIGELVRVRGVRPRQAEMIAAIALAGADDVMIIDEGPPEEDEAPEPPSQPVRTVQGALTRFLHGPKGEVRGAVLSDGTYLRWPHHESKRLAKALRPGSPLFVRGVAHKTPFGMVVAVRALGPTADEMESLEKKKKKPHGDHPKHHDRREGDRGKDRSTDN